MIARAWYCDKDGCETHTHPIPAEHPPQGFLTVCEGIGSMSAPIGPKVFCSWDCLMQYAATFPPPEFLPFDEVEA